MTDTTHVLFLAAAFFAFTSIAAAESGPPPDFGMDQCSCNAECADEDVCVWGSAGRRVCCPSDAFDECPSDPGDGIMCPVPVDLGPTPAFDLGPTPSFDMGPPISEEDDGGCAAAGSPVALAWPLALGLILVRRRSR